MRLFSKRKASTVVPPKEPFKYPSGIVVTTESGQYYLKGLVKYRIRSKPIFKSWGFPLVVESTDAAISNYRPSLKRLGFRDGTIIRDIYDGRLYIIADSKRVQISSVEAYEALGIEGLPDNYVSHEDVLFHSDGGEI